MKRIPTLDGWRGIAILMVLVAHLQEGRLGYVFGRYRWLNPGLHGVTLFFVLSGYLITNHLLTEERIDLKRFYIRRFFRLMPCAWAYLLMLAIAGVISHQTILGRDALPCLLFFRNYYPANSAAATWTGHFWSLSVEEQFYLAWPPLLGLMGQKRAAGLAIGAILTCASVRFLHWQSYGQPYINLHSEVHIDAILVGCVLAMLLKKESVRNWFQRFGGTLTWIIIPLFLWHIYYFQVLIPLTESLLIASLIACTSRAPSFLASMLEWKHLKFLGAISYSLYLWHLGPFGIAFLPIIVIISYGAIERPCNNFGHRVCARPRLRMFDSVSERKQPRLHFNETSIDG
jgi:peptidoglycan/LPS O-acetylase OafA/YrhL